MNKTSVYETEGPGLNPGGIANYQSEARARRAPALEAGGRWAEHRTLTITAP